MPKQFSITLRRNQLVETTQPRNSFKKGGRAASTPCDSHLEGAATCRQSAPSRQNRAGCASRSNEELLHQKKKLHLKTLRVRMRILTRHCTSRTQEAEPVDDVVPVHHSFIFELLSTEGQSLLLRKGAILDLDLALDVVNCVRRLHIQRDRVASQRFHTLLNVDRRSATMVV